MGRVQDKVAVVTGGTGGLGKKTVEYLLKEGAKVLIVDLKEDDLRKAKEELEQYGEVHTVVADVSKESDVENYVKTAMDAFGRIDIFFNNAGILGEAAPIMEMDVEDFDEVFSINVRGVFLGMKYVLRVMKEQKSGSVINTSSIDGLSGSLNRVAYSGTKHAVVGMTKTAAIEMGPYKVRVNSIHPGYSATTMMDDAESGLNADDPDSVKEEFLEKIPLSRYGEPEDIANLVLFLGSDESSYISGTQMLIDGGLLAQ